MRARTAFAVAAIALFGCTSVIAQPRVSQAPTRCGERRGRERSRRGAHSRSVRVGNV
jgi:hypothetical protein